MLVLIAVGVVTDVARSKRISTRDPSLTVVPSPTDPLLVLLAYGTVQAFNPSLPPAIFVSQLSHVTVLHSQSKSRLHFSYVEYVTFRFLCSRASFVVLLVAALFILQEQLAKGRLRKKKNARNNGRPRGKLRGHFNLTYGTQWPRAACDIVNC